MSCRLQRMRVQAGQAITRAKSFGATSAPLDFSTWVGEREMASTLFDSDPAALATAVASKPIAV